MLAWLYCHNGQRPLEPDTFFSMLPPLATPMLGLPGHRTLIEVFRVADLRLGGKNGRWWLRNW